MSSNLADFRPPVEKGEFITTIGDDPDNRVEVGVLFVGAGPASLAGAIRLSQLLSEEPDLMESLGEIPIAIIEKGKYPGAHLLSGAVVNPMGFRTLFPDMKDSDFPFFEVVKGEAVYYLTKKGSLRLPTPPTMQNKGNYVASISKMGEWLGQKAEENGVMIFNEMAGEKLIIEDGVVKGVKTDDKGLDKNGDKMNNYQPGTDILAKTTVLGEGTTGHLSMALTEHYDLKRANPQIYALGVKEIWEVTRPLEKVIHTMGWPLRGSKKYSEFGGSFIYPMGDKKVSLGLVVGLDYADSKLSVHDLLQQLKTHPLVSKVLEGGKRADSGWGAKTIPEGGYYAVPESLSVPGALLVGDCAGLVNVPALKGIHYAMMSGIMAADSIFAALREKRDLSQSGALAKYDETLRSSFIWKDLYSVRNMRQVFQGGFLKGFILAGLMTLTKGLFPGGRFSSHHDYEKKLFIGSHPSYSKPDGKLTFDKLTSVYESGNRTRDNQPDHIRIIKEVPEVIGETWINMCPAQVYEWDENENTRVIRTDPSNCVQCGAITAKGGRLLPPEGGGGPEYKET